MHISIHNDPESGWYGWLLRDGPDDAYVKGGVAPTISKAMTAVTLARAEIARYVAGDPYPVPPSLIHKAPDPQPPKVHPPYRDPLPLQQDVPTVHQPDLPFSYLASSRFG